MIVNYNSADNTWNNLFSKILPKEIEISDEIKNLFQKIEVFSNLNAIPTEGWDEWLKKCQIADKTLLSFLDDANYAEKTFSNYEKYLNRNTSITSKFSTALSKVSGVLKSVGGNLVAFAANAAVMYGISKVAEVVIKTIGEMANSTENLKESAKEIGTELSSESSEINDYKQQIQELQDVINDSSSSVEEVTQARRDLMTVQDELIEKFGSEKSVIETVTDAIDGQVDALDELSRKSYFQKKNEFNEKTFGDKVIDWLSYGTTDDERIMTDMEKMVNQMRYASYSLTTTGNEDIDKLISNAFDFSISDDIYGDGQHFVITGELDAIQEKLYGIQTLTSGLDLSSGFSNSFSEISNEVDSFLSSYQYLYEQYVLWEKILNTDSENFYDEQYNLINQAKKEYDDAVSSGDTAEIEKATEKYSQTLASAMQLATSNYDYDVADYFENMYPAMQKLFGEWKFNFDFEPNTEGIQDKVAESLKGLDGLSSEDILGLNSSVATQEQLDSYGGLINISEQYGLTLEQLINLLVKMGLVQSENYQRLVELFGQENIDKIALEDLVYAYSIENIGELSFEELQTEIQNLKDEAASVDTIDMSTLATNTTTLLSNIEAVNSAIASFGTGQSITPELFDSEELKTYSSALEYVNGSLQLNKEKVEELAKAQTDEAIATNEAAKAQKQSQYLENARKIEELRDSLVDSIASRDGNADSIRNEISALEDDNSLIVSQCNQLDLYNASLRESMGVYQQWLDSQNTSESGDMFDDTQNAWQLIRDTADADSDMYGRVGREDYKAAVEFIIPETIDQSDAEAVQSYMDSVAKYMTFDKDGNINGMNIDQFVQDSVDQGLLIYDEASDSYNVAGGKLMEDFAEGLNLSMPMVQAMFGELEEFGAKFTWADEANKTIGDLAIAANEAKQNLEGVGGEAELIIDVTSIEDTETKISTLQQTIHDAQQGKLQFDVDSTEFQELNAIIEYCQAQINMLNQPVVMQVDTGSMQGSTATAISYLQQFQTLKNEIATQQVLGLDTSEAQSELEEVTTKIQGLSEGVTASLGIDTTSVETIEQSIQNISMETLVSVGIDETMLTEFQAEEHTADAIVIWENDDSAVTNWIGQEHIADGMVNWDNDITKVATEFAATGTVTWKSVGETSAATKSSSESGSIGLNGTAHAAGNFKMQHAYGKAMANGSWAAKQGGTTLVGELGREIVVDPRTGRWHTVGDNGAEFTDIPQGAIVFNHKQTEVLLERGFVNGRGTALASGTAMVGGGEITIGHANNNQYDSNGNALGSAKDASKSLDNLATSADKASDSADEASSALDKLLEKLDNLIDWIEYRRNYLSGEIDYKLAQSENATGYTKKNKKVSIAQSITSSLIEVDKKALKKYEQHAESIRKEIGLSESLAKKVREGTIEIETLSEDDKKRVEKYQEWYDKIKVCRDEIEELNTSLKELAQQKIDNITEQFDAVLEKIDHRKNTIDSFVENAQLKGYVESTKYYDKLIKNENKTIAQLNKERDAMQKSFDESVASGAIKKGSLEYKQMQNEINGVTEEINEATNAALELANTARQIKWDRFDSTTEGINTIVDEAEFLLGLLDSEDMYNEKGNVTAEGKATYGLNAVKYQTALDQVERARLEQKELDLYNEDGTYNQDALKRWQELEKVIQENASAADDAKESMKELVKEGIEAQLSALKELIDEYMEALKSQKELYDYQQDISEKTEEISKLQKRLAVYSGDDSEEGRLKRQQTEEELKKAQKELEETEYDKFISDQEELLNNLFDDFEEALNKRLDNFDETFEAIQKGISDNADIIKTTLENQVDDVGAKLSTTMSNIWGEAGSNGILSSVDSGVQSIVGFMEILTKQADQNSVGNTGTDKEKQSAIKSLMSQGTKHEGSLTDSEKKTHSDLWEYLVEEYGYTPYTGVTTDLANVLGVELSNAETPTSKDKANVLAALKKLNGDDKKTSTQSATAKDTAIKTLAEKYKVAPSDAIIKELARLLRIEVSSKLTDAEKLKVLDALKIKGYAKGTDYVKEDEWANISELGAEIITLPDGSFIYPIKKGSGVINHAKTEEITSLAENHDRIMDVVNNSSNMLNRQQAMLGDTQRSLRDAVVVNNNDGRNINVTNEITFELPGVTTYEDFMTKAQHDSRFEKMIQTMSIGRVNGQSKLAKYNYKW